MMRRNLWIVLLLLALLQGNAPEADGASSDPGPSRTPDRLRQVATGPLPRIHPGQRPGSRTLGPNAPSNTPNIIGTKEVPPWQRIKVQIDGLDWGGGLHAVGQCGAKNITVRGKRLNLISRVRITDSGGGEAATVRGKLNWPSFKQGGVEKRMALLEADCNAAPGAYRLELHQRAGPIQNGTAGLSVLQKPAAPPPVRNATFSSAMLHEALRTPLMAAFLFAHSCGPLDKDRNVSIVLPTLSYAISQPLSRFERKTTPNERISYWAARAQTHTVCAIRSCVNSWMGTSWRGDIANGKILLRVDINPNHGFRNRGLYGDVCEIGNQDVILFKWGDFINDGEVPDRLIDTLRFYITLQPTVDPRGKLSYGNVSVSHTIRNARWDINPPLDFIPSTIKADLDTYMNHSFSAAENELKKAFESNTTREQISDSMMSRLNGIDKITRVSGSGSSLTVTY